MRRAWISSSRSATRCRARSAPISATKSVTGAWPLPDPAKFTAAGAERATLLNELYAGLRRRLEIFTSLPFASLDRMALQASGSTRSATGRDRRADDNRRRLTHARRHQRHGPHRAACACARRWAAWSGQPDDPRAGNRLDVVHVNEIKGGAGGDRASAGIRQPAWPLAATFGGEGDSAILIGNRRIGFSDMRRRRATCRGAISAAISCWNAPANS